MWSRLVKSTCLRLRSRGEESGSIVDLATSNVQKYDGDPLMETSLHFPDIVLRLLSRRTAILRLREMRRIAILLLLAGSALSCAAVKPVTAEQLERILAATHEVSDAQMAAQLSDLTLIERLSPAAFSRCEAGLP